MKRAAPDKSLVAALAAVATFVGALLLLQTMPGLLDKPAIFVALLFFPLVVYAVASGAIAEISGPGGWAAKFRDTAETPVSLDAEVLSINIVPKQEVAALQRRMNTLEANSALAITLEVDVDQDPAAMHYTPGDLAEYLSTLLKVDPELTIIYVDRQGRFLASSDALSVIQLQDADNHLNRFVAYVNMYDPTEIRKIVPLTTKRLSPGQTNADALRAMNADGVRSIIVVDEFRKPVGVVRRDTVMARLMESLLA